MMAMDDVQDAQVSREAGKPGATGGSADHAKLITDNIDIWTSAIKTRSASGRGSSKKLDLYGIKKLRELILELAVRGKLVPQDVSDEPASVLLDRIEAEKARLVKEKKIKKTKAQVAVSESEVCVSLPKNWGWVRFGDIAQHNSGKTLDKGRNSGIARPYLTTSNLYWGRFELDNVREMLIRDEELDKCSVAKGDLLICEGGDAGRAAVWNSEHDVCFQNHIHRARFFGAIDPYYAFRVFEKLSATGEIDQYRKGVGISNMSGKALASVVFPLPPLAEQHRIVSKVDKLMALCDQLEQQTEASIDAHATLVETLLATLTNSADDVQDAQVSREARTPGATAVELEQNWTRIAAHFDTLFTIGPCGERSIDQLKQTVLQLAVMGKLVPQDPNDEPAAVLLEKIAAEKAQLVKEKKIKKQKTLPPIGEDEKPFALPAGWEWCRLQETVLILGDGLHGTPHYDEKGDYYFVNGNNLRDGKIVIKPDTKRVNQKEHEKHRKQLNERTVLVSINGTLGNVAFYNDEPVMLGKSACYFNLWCELDKYFYKRLIESPYFLSYSFSKATGSTIKNLGLKAMNLMPIALPPLEEQRRIVAKVDQLMTLFDQLKDRLQHAQQTQLHLADALVEQALNP